MFKCLSIWETFQIETSTEVKEFSSTGLVFIFKSEYINLTVKLHPNVNFVNNK